MIYIGVVEGIGKSNFGFCQKVVDFVNESSEL